MPRFSKLSLGFALCVVLCVSFIDVRGSPVVENTNDGDDAEDDKLSPELEELLMKKKRRFDCPLCDSSVYSYCSDKLLHDACCCLSPYETHLPLQCKFADCSFLHANSCKEHRLITACCCNQLAN
ncbi:uncharacterized protein LOC135843501 [Planococcus citri]|uniref:uncharacterized protein LOC135843501 n=1 Tax=Planococcus citri TaxID=170843 RepID=UPI0031F91099